MLFSFNLHNNYFIALFLVILSLFKCCDLALFLNKVQFTLAISTTCVSLPFFVDPNIMDITNGYAGYTLCDFGLSQMKDNHMW